MLYCRDLGEKGVLLPTRSLRHSTCKPGVLMLPPPTIHADAASRIARAEEYALSFMTGYSCLFKSKHVSKIIVIKSKGGL